MITILTATYNRAHTLNRLFSSLEAQSDKRFKWIVVNDGSTDNTIELLQGFQEIASFPITVLSQKNSGKHVAINTGLASTTDEWVFLVDSDDLLTHNAVEIFHGDSFNISDDHIVSFCYRKADLAGQLIGKLIAEEDGKSAYMTPTEASNFYKGDLAYIFRTRTLLKYPFPSFVDEKFVPELLIWNRVADDGQVLFFHHQIIYLCEYLDDGYSANFIHNLRRNPRGFGIYYKSQINRESSIIRKVKCVIRYLQCLFFLMIKKPDLRK
ncbi:glycosyltransferase family A protein [Pseudomonas lundensis]|uniref:glycosyltransferase family A protein n=1 Tax=Pseudomonas lundensis TaxID=86185 RepID=UPI00089DBB2E|nr:glycosyltransferase family 2 protein [Pseudomonas lundensis]